MSDQTYRLNSRVATPEKEYLVQTVNDLSKGRVLSSVFSDGELLETQEETLQAGMSSDDVLRAVKETHEERTKELEYLISMFKEMIEGQDVESIDYLGQALYHKRMSVEALKLFQRAVSIKQDSHEAWAHLGMVLMDLGRARDACEAFAKCTELRPNYADYRNNLGEAYLALDSCKRAVIEFEEAARLNIYYGEAYLNLALAYVLNAIRREDFKLFSSQSEKTDEVLRKTEVIMPEIVDPVYLEGKKYLQHGDLEKAFQKLLLCREKRKDKKRQDFSAFYMKFMLCSDRVNERLLTKRIRHLQDAISSNPHFADLHLELAVAYTLLGRYVHNNAVDEYNKALSINPDFEKAKRNLKLAQNELKGFDVLIKALTRG